jgi:eukaryotic-like serine/threonine-protein kinase
MRIRTALAAAYVIDRELGAGGMATVYLAHDLKHDRDVAIKVLHPDLGATLGADRFLSEIRTTARLQHPHILPLLDSGSADGLLYYVMPLVTGESLRTRLNRERQLPIDEAVRIASEIASALDYAHRHHVIHRDIKPENILLQDGQAIVADFGIALAVQHAGGARMTQTGLSVGTPHYMSPEQATAEREITGRSDQYSLASVLYEMLAGQPPHTGGAAQQVIMKIVTEDAVPVSSHRKSVPPNVSAAVAKALEKVPADRFETTRAFADALRDAAFSTAHTRVSATAEASTSRWLRDTRTLATIGVGVAGIIMASTFRRDVPRDGPREYDIGLPDSAAMTTVSQDAGFAVSPAADFVVYETSRHGRSELWYRSLRDAVVRPIAGTIGGTQPVLSPDGTRVVFFRLAEGGWTVEVVPIDGDATATVITRGVSSVRKLLWITDDRILLFFSDLSLVHRLSPRGGPVDTISTPYCEGHSAIAGTDRLLCGGGTAHWGSQIVVGDTGIGRPLWRQEDSSRVVGSSFQAIDGKYLTYLSTSAELLAAPVDLQTGRVGRAVRMATGIGLSDWTGNGSYVISATGTIVYAQRDNKTMGHLVHLTERRIDTLPVGRESFSTFAHSPDGQRLAAVVQALDGMELRIYDLSTGRYRTWIRRSRLVNPVWSPSGDQLLFGDTDSLFVGSPDRADAPEFLLHLSGGFEMNRWIGDGRVVGWRYHPQQTLLMHIDRRPVTIDTLLQGSGFAFPSADGRWIGYTNAAFTEAWVEPLPRDGRRFQVASGNLDDPQWLSEREFGVPLVDGRRTRIERVTIDPTSNLPARNRGVWAEVPDYRNTNGPSFASVPGGGVVYLRGAADRPASYLRVIPGWVDRMKQAVDAANQ